VVSVLPDRDFDRIGDATDNCPDAANNDQLNTDGDAQGNACDLDDDNDTVADASDNCALAADPDQLDADGDAQGNACDLDDDGDGVLDAADACPLTAAATADGCALPVVVPPPTVAGGPGVPPPVAGTAIKPAVPDGDGDGKPDSADRCPTIAGPTAATGCPARARAVSLKYSAAHLAGGTHRLAHGLGAPPVPLDTGQAAPLSPVSLYARQKVTIFVVRNGPDKKFATATTGAKGAFALTRRAKPGTYYAVVAPVTIATAGTCARARSKPGKVSARR